MHAFDDETLFTPKIRKLGSKRTKATMASTKTATNNIMRFGFMPALFTVKYSTPRALQGFTTNIVMGEIYHVINRGDRREAIFEVDQDRESFLTGLAERLW